MALSSNNIINWDDIKNLFHRANAERARFNYSTSSSYGTNPGISKASQVQELGNMINELTSTSFLSSAASTSGVAFPSKDDVMYPVSLNSLDNILTNVERIQGVESTCTTFYGDYVSTGTCTGFNASTFFSTYFGSFDGTFHNAFAAFFSSYNGSFGTFFSSYNGSFGTFFSSYFGSNGSFFSSYFGSNGTFFSSYFGSFGPSCASFNTGFDSGFTTGNTCSTHNGSKMTCFSFGFDDGTGSSTGFSFNCGSFTNGESCTFFSSHTSCNVHNDSCPGGFFFSSWTSFCNIDCSSGFGSSCSIDCSSGFGSTCSIDCSGTFGTSCSVHCSGTFGTSCSVHCNSGFAAQCVANFQSTVSQCAAFNAPFFSSGYFSSGFTFFASGFNSAFNVAGFCTAFDAATFFDALEP